MRIRQFIVAIVVLVSFGNALRAQESSKTLRQLFEDEIKKMNKIYQEKIAELDTFFELSVNVKKEKLVQELEQLHHQANAQNNDSVAQSLKLEISKINEKNWGSPTIQSIEDLQTRLKSQATLLDNSNKRLRTLESENSKLRNVPKLPTPPLPKDTVEFYGHHYLVVSDSLIYLAASLRCTQQGGHLARIESPEEHVFIRTLLGESKKQGFWIDGSDQIKEGEWRFSNGDQTKYSGWAKGQPDGGTRNNFAYIWPAANWMIDDTGSNAEQFFICEWDY